MTRRIIGIPLDTLKAQARTAVLNHYTGHESWRPAGLAAMDAKKAAAAADVLAGGVSDLIQREAAARELAPLTLAGDILTRARKSEDLEIERVKLNVAIDAATTHSAVQRILMDAGIALSAMP